MSKSGKYCICRLAIAAILAGLCVAPIPARLPDEALKRAQKAEKQLAANQPLEAIVTLVQLDKEFPGEAALSLRIAQVYDKLNESGPTLFYYRRYYSIAGDKAREEAQTRLFALELEPGAAKAAESFAEKLGEKSTPIAPPKPKITNRSLAIMAPDGSLKNLKGPQELAQVLQQAEDPQAWSTAPQAESQSETDASETGVQSKTRVLHTPSPTLQRALLPSTPIPPVKTATPISTKRVSAGPTPKATPAKGVFTPPAMPGKLDEQMAISAASAQTRPMATKKAQARATLSPVAEKQTDDTTAEPAQEPSAPPARTKKTLASGITPLATIKVEIEPVPSLSEAQQRASANEQDAFPAPAAPTVSSSQPPPASSRFFSTTSVGGKTAVIRLTNQLTGSYMTFNAVPENGKATSAILGNGESRTLKLPAGSYEVIVNVTNNNYPPSTVLNKKFHCDFRAGVEYQRTLTLDNVKSGE